MSGGFLSIRYRGTPAAVLGWLRGPGTGHCRLRRRYVQPANDAVMVGWIVEDFHPSPDR